MNACYRCKYRGDVKGSAHSCCRYPGNEVASADFFDPVHAEAAKKLRIMADGYGVEMGWFYWPLRFDPVWLLNCDGFEEIAGEAV